MFTKFLLGLHIDERLTWSIHIDHLCSAISSKILLLKQLAEYVPVDVQNDFNQGYILPLIDYGSITWGASSKYDIERVSKLQKRATRIILKADFDTSSDDMFQNLYWPSIEKRLKYSKAVLTYRALNKQTPDYISSLLKPLSETHSLNLRSSENICLHIPRLHTTLYDNSVTCSAPNLWNAFPQIVREADTLLTFKNNLKCS